MGYDDYGYDYEDQPSKWEAEDNRSEAEYDIKKDKCAHFSKNIWNKVSHMPTSEAVMYGEELTKIANQVVFNREIVESIWGKDFDKSSEFFNV
jgi:hypothetical protein